MSATFFLSLREGTSVSGAHEELVVRSESGRVTFRQPYLGTLAALRQLADRGADEALLHELALADGGAEALARLLYSFERLDRHGMLLRSICSAGEPLVTLVPISPYFVFVHHELESHLRYVLSRFAHVRQEGRQMLLESPRSHARVVLHGGRAAAILHALLDGKRPTQPAARELELWDGVVRLLLAAGMIDVVASGEPEEGQQDTTLRSWGFHDLVFHAGSRMGRNDRPVGGTYRFAPRIPPPPPLHSLCTSVDIADWIDLPRPNLASRMREDPPLMRVAQIKRPLLKYGVIPISILELSEFLYRTARVKRCQQVQVPTPAGLVSMELALRPYPGGGALYELEIYPAIQRCTGLGAGLYYYDPLHHRLRRLCQRTAEVERMFLRAACAAELASAQLQVLIVVAARFERRAWKYAAIAYSTVLKDVGVLYETMYLAAAAMRLAPCAVECGTAALFARAMGSDSCAECSVGEFLLGSR